MTSKISSKAIDMLNKKIMEYWKQPRHPKPDIHKLYLEMKDDPIWKDKVWHPMSAESVAKHLQECRLYNPKSGSSGC